MVNFYERETWKDLYSHTTAGSFPYGRGGKECGHYIEEKTKKDGYQIDMHLVILMRL
jgi:hypothetical protein